jgi:hypothetical protein
MKHVGYIGEFSGKHMVYSVVDQVWSVSEYSSEGLCKKKMQDMKASAMILLFEDFLALDSKIEDLGKNVVSYKELRKRIQDYVTWGLDNHVVSPEKVVLNGFKMKSRMWSMINMISEDHADRGKLIFIWKNVTLLYEEPYNI